MVSSCTRRAAAAIAAFIALAATGCFEPPVSESVELRFIAGGGVLVTAAVKITADDSDKDNRFVQERVDQTRQALLRGDDFWSRRFEAMRPQMERLSWEKEQGKLSRSIHGVYASDPDSLRRLFGGGIAGFSYRSNDAWAEVVLDPVPGNRASGAQQRQVMGDLDLWAGRVAAYLSDGKRLYDRLEDHPGRAQACFGHLFQELLSEDQQNGLEDLEDEEAPLVKSMQERLSDLLGLFAIPSNSAYSPDEFFRLVYDGFPAPLSVRVPGEILESEGFVVDKEGRLVAPDLSLYGAVRSLEGRWLSPDPFLAYVEHARGAEGKPFDLESFLRKPRSAALAPSQGEVREAIGTHLERARNYRVRWRTTEPAGPLEHWQQLDEPPSQP